MIYTPALRRLDVFPRGARPAPPPAGGESLQASRSPALQMDSHFTFFILRLVSSLSVHEPNHRLFSLFDLFSDPAAVLLGLKLILFVFFHSSTVSFLPAPMMEFPPASSPCVSQQHPGQQYAGTSTEIYTRGRRGPPSFLRSAAPRNETVFLGPTSSLFAARNEI